MMDTARISRKLETGMPLPGVIIHRHCRQCDSTQLVRVMQLQYNTGYKTQCIQCKQAWPIAAQVLLRSIDRELSNSGQSSRNGDGERLSREPVNVALSPDVTGDHDGRQVVDVDHRSDLLLSIRFDFQ